MAGVVTEIGHQAHHQLQMRNDHLEFDDEYLDPLGDDDSIIIVQNERGGVQPRSPPSTDDGDSSNYYGFHQGDDAPRPHRPEEVLAPRRQIAEGWKAVNKYAANPFSSTAAAECQDTISSLSRSRKRATSPEINDEREIGAGECVDRNDNDSSNNKEDQEDEDNTSTLNCEVVERVAKRPRLANHDSSLSPATTPSPSHALSARLATRDASGSPRSVTPRKTSIKMLWTKQEEDLLVKSRDQGKTWDEIQDVSSIKDPPTSRWLCSRPCPPPRRAGLAFKPFMKYVSEQDLTTGWICSWSAATLGLLAIESTVSSLQGVGSATVMGRVLELLRSAAGQTTRCRGCPVSKAWIVEEAVRSEEVRPGMKSNQTDTFGSQTGQTSAAKLSYHDVWTMECVVCRRAFFLLPL